MQPRVFAVVSWGPDRLDICGLGTDRSMYHKAWMGSAWQANWENLGGVFTSPPTVVAWGPDRLDIFGLGTDHAMYHKAWMGSAWQANWENLGGVFTSPPTVVAWGPDRLDIFGLGTDYAMYHKAWLGAEWQANWENLGGVFTSPPSVVSWGSNRLDIFGLGTNRSMYHKAWLGAEWQANWENLGGTFDSPPSVVSWGSNRLDIFGLGTNRSMYHKAWLGDEWQANWENLGGTFDSPPSVVAWGPNRLDIFGLGTDRSMYHKAWMGSVWQANWENLGGVFTSAPNVVAWGSNRLDTFGLGTDYAMYHKAWMGSAWQANWENLGGVFSSPLESGAIGPQKLLIIAPDDFMSALQPLVQHKIQSGMSTTAVSISSLTPFFQGVDDPETIKNAIQYAYENLSTQYVMLIGNAHRFPVRYMFMHGLSVGYSGDPNAAIPADGDYIPSDLYYANLYHHTGIPWEKGPFDNWDANGNGLYNEGTWGDPDPFTLTNPDHVDGLPDVAVGRVPADNIQDVTAYVNKVIAYELPQGRSLSFTFVADQLYGSAVQLTTGVVTGSGLMGSISSGQASYLLIENTGNPPPGWINASPADVANSAKLSTWVSYVGHGSPHAWGYDSVFGEANVAETAEGSVLPVVFAAGCSTGEFVSDHPWNAEYVDVAGIRHNFGPYPGAKPGVDGPVIKDAISGQLWGVNCSGCNPLPLISPKPNVYDYDRGADLCFAYPWLIANAPGGGIAYFGEVGVAEDPMGAELEKYLLAAYVTASSPILGDLYLKAQQQYWGKHQTLQPNQDYHSVPRFYLGWMVFFGDPSLRLPPLQ